MTFSTVPGPSTRAGRRSCWASCSTVRGHAPCPFCGGSDRFYLHSSGRFGCRGCGFKGDAASLAAKVRNVSPVEAARWLLGEEPVGPKQGGMGRPAGALPPVSVAHRGKQVRERTPEWVEEALRVVERAEKAFPGSPAEAYMAERGLEGACAEYRIGYDPRAFDPVGKTGRPAVVVPSLDRDGKPLAVKFRYLDELGRTDKGRRFGMLKGSTPLLFGLHALRARTRLVVIEGEMNALAVRVACPDADVLSIGSQTLSEAARMLLTDTANGYRDLVVWADEAESSRRIGAAIGCRALKRSPDGLDANDILMRFGPESLARLCCVKGTPGSESTGCIELGSEVAYDPFADGGSAERAAEPLMRYLLEQGWIRLDSSGRMKVVQECPKFVREDVRLHRSRLLKILEGQ